MTTFVAYAMTHNGDRGMADRARWACDTSVAVSALDSTHEAHRSCREALVELRPALAGHAVFETFSVLTRLPAPLRLSVQQAAYVISVAFPEACALTETSPHGLLDRFAARGIGGGSVYDGLVAEAALANDRILLTRDRRAERTYQQIGVTYRFVD